MVVFANDYIGIHVNQFGVFERDELEGLFEFLSPLSDVFAEGVALDVGANVGNHAIYFSKRFGRVHAFEPHPMTFDVLALNAKWSSNVEPHPVGLGDEPGPYSLSSDPTHLGLSSLKEGDVEGALQIDVRRLDDLELDRDRVCFIKMDVEGFEANVIEGGRQLLADCQPVVVLEQHEGEFQQCGTSRSVGLLAEAGYTFCWFENPRLSRSWVMRRVAEVTAVMGGVRRTIFTSDRVPPGNYTMLIAVPPKYRARLGLVDEPLHPGTA